MVLAVNDLVRYLVFPTTVLVIGAVVTGLIPRWNRHREEYRRALEVKTHLVTEMSRIVIGFVTAVRFAVEEGTTTGTKAPEYVKEYKTWENERAVLGTKLEAYFPETSIQGDWRMFVDHMTELYEITRLVEPEPATLEARASRLQAGLIELRTKCHRERLQKQSGHKARQQKGDEAANDTRIKTGDPLGAIEQKLRRAALDCKGELIQMVMEWRLDGLEEPSMWERIRERATEPLTSWLGKRHEQSRPRYSGGHRL